MSTPHERPLFLRFAALIVAGLPMLAAHCDHDEYPLQPTFCDDWCRVLLRPRCDLEPENCVRECEASVARGACLERQRELLTCYEATRVRDWECTEMAFQEIPRPRASICQAERDALIGCEYPRVLACIEACRNVAATLPFDGGVDAPDDRVCPGAAVPCDSMCWALDAALGRVPAMTREDASSPREAAGGDASSDTATGDFATGDAGTVEEVLAVELFQCAVGRAAECYLPPDAGAAGDAGPHSANWVTVARDCARELGVLR